MCYYCAPYQYVQGTAEDGGQQGYQKTRMLTLGSKNKLMWVQNMEPVLRLSHDQDSKLEWGSFTPPYGVANIRNGSPVALISSGSSNQCNTIQAFSMTCFAYSFLSRRSVEMVTIKVEVYLTKHAKFKGLSKYLAFYRTFLSL